MTNDLKFGDGSQENKILIVDDKPENIDVLRKTLEPEGYKIYAATSGEAAIKIVSRLAPDLIILDITMPGMDGFVTCEKIKENPSLNDIPIIFISAKMEADNIVKSFECGGADYIIKPIRQEEVLSRVKTQLQLKILTEERLGLIEELQKANKKLAELGKQ